MSSGDNSLGDGPRQCRSCSVWKPIDAFQRHNADGVLMTYNTCTVCSARNRVKYEAKLVAKLKPHLEALGMTLEEAIVARRKCPRCGKCKTLQGFIAEDGSLGEDGALCNYCVGREAAAEAAAASMRERAEREQRARDARSRVGGFWEHLDFDGMSPLDPQVYPFSNVHWCI